MFRESKEQCPIRAYFDVDGFLTDISGSKLLKAPYNEFFDSLFVDPFEYETSEFKNVEKLYEVMKENFAKFDKGKGFNIKSEAKACIEAILENKGEVVIISNNRREYIINAFLLAGFKNETIQQITIYDIQDIAKLSSVEEPDKGKCLIDHETKCSQATRIVIGDDSKDPFEDMFNAAKTLKEKDDQVRYKESDIIAIHCKPGECNFVDLQNKLIPKSGEKKEEDAPPRRMSLTSSS